MNIYQIKVTLRHINPLIWRRTQVVGDTRLGQLHHILQIVMGWTNSHMHGFRVGRDNYGALDPDFPDDVKDERNVRLDTVAKQGSTLIYDYDFGDGWEHELKIEKVVDPDPAARYPVCLAGQRACPPEDCGGPPGYADLLDILDDPEHEEYEDMAEWAGEDFDAEAFDLDEVNRLLRHLR